MDCIWVRKNESEVPFCAWVIERLTNHLRVRDDNGKELKIRPSDILRPMHHSCIEDVEDMTMMGELEEYTILRNLHLRYKKNLIYTYTGNVLIAVNPYQELPIYGKDFIEKYRNKKLGELPPHIFAIGDISFENMRDNEGKQCIIINGESGAGKTKSAKLLLQYYAAITGKSSATEEQILMSTPILEAFGNAKTVRNNNSSRFGKYIFINFNREGRMEQAEIKEFLLERSRIVTQCKGEKNYHVFYLLFKGLAKEEKNLLGLKEVSFYRYLNESSADSKVDEGEIGELHVLRKALKILNFKETIIWEIFELLAAILHFGNVDFSRKNESGVETVDVVNSAELTRISTLLGVPKHCLKLCLTKKTIDVVSEKVSKGLNQKEAEDNRDAFVKAIYVNLFNYIVGRINETIQKNSSDAEGYIGVLDVFGFENFETNSFEQFCINMANEYLQQFFIRHTFKIEQKQYLDEDIPWKVIHFVDNDDIINMLCVAPMNIVSIINDQSSFPGSTDEALLEKLVEHHQNDGNFFTPKFNNIQAFGIYHFAGVVLYNVKDFLEKNRDSCSVDFVKLAKSSENYLLAKIFAGYTEESRSHVSKKKKIQTTSVTKFKHSLEALMGELRQCRPFFIRCIKPNKLQKPNLFDRELCCQQLRYSGILETSRIRKAGYPIRYSYMEFVLRYGALRPGLSRVNSLAEADLREAADDICFATLKYHPVSQFGRTRVFLTNSEYLMLERAREEMLSRFVVILQRRIRGWICRKRYVALRRAAIIVQRFWRGRRLRKDYLVKQRGFARLQSLISSRYRRASYLRTRRLITRFQARCKGFAVRRKFYQFSLERAIKLKLEEPDILEEKVTKSNWEVSFTRGQPVKQKSYLHGYRGRRIAPDRAAEFSKQVDDYFHFLEN